MDIDAIKQAILAGSISTEELSEASKNVTEAARAYAMSAEQLATAIQSVFDWLRNLLAPEEFLESMEDAKLRIEYLREERERWGHPPKQLCCGYRAPVRSIKPCARSAIRKRCNRRRA